MTYRGCYQVLLVFFLVVAPLQAAIDLQFVRTLNSTIFSLLLAALLLQPAAAIGLWYDKPWGLLLLVTAIVMCLLTSLGGSIGALVILPLAAIRFYVLKRRVARHEDGQDVLHPPMS
jgi:hypothetical protein